MRNVLARALALAALAGCGDDLAEPTGGSTEPATTTMATTGAPVTTTTESPTTTTDGGSSAATTEETTGGPGSSTGIVDTGLCERLGGPAGAQAVALELSATLRGDDRINAYFLNAELDGGRFVDCLIDQVATFAGCPGATYTCLDMKSAHAGRKISAIDFADFIADVTAALAVHQANAAPMLTDDDVADLLAMFAASEADVVEDANDDGTLYQRLGRKPGLRALVGAPDEAGSWLSAVLADAALSGFFAGLDEVRFQTCLVRQLGSLDGPVSYGAEVDAPAGVDPGVSMAMQCRGMQVAHAGVTNAMLGDAPIVAADFVLMLAHLSTAAEAMGASGGDVAELAAALEPLCPEIVSDAENCPGATQVEIFEEVDLAAPIDDGLYDGTPATMTCQTLSVAASGLDVVAAVEVEVGIDTGYVGDLTIKVIAPGTEPVTLVSRPGLEEAADDGSGCSGDNSNLEATSPITFRVDALKDAEVMGDTLDTDAVICADDGVCSYTPNPGAATGPALASLAGTAAPGDWQVCVGDSCGGFTATLQSVRLRLTRTQ